MRECGKAPEIRSAQGLKPTPIHPVTFSPNFEGNAAVRFLCWINLPHRSPQCGQPRHRAVGAPGEGSAETPRWGGCLPFRVGQASRPAIRRPHSPGPCPGTPLPPKGGPHRNPAKRLRWGEEEQGSAVGNARRAFPTERTLFRRGRKEFNAEEDRNHYRSEERRVGKECM